MFKWLMEAIRPDIEDSGELILCNNLPNSTSMDLLSVVKIVESTQYLFFKKKRIHSTGFKLQQLLPNKDIVNIGEGHKRRIAEVKIDEKFQAKAGIKVAVPIMEEFDGKMDGNGSGNMSATLIQLEHVSADLQEVDIMSRQSILDKDHLLIQQMKNNNKIRGLGVVYEIIRTENAVTLEQITKGKVKGTVKGTVKGVLNIQPSVNFEGKNTRQLKLPIGCILAFRIYDLCLKTTEATGSGDEESGAFLSDGGFGEEVVRDFPTLKRHVEKELCDFGEMDQSVRKLIWDPLYKTLKCPKALYAFDCMLAEGGVSTDSSSLEEVAEDVRRSVHDLLQLMELDSVESESHSLLKPIGFLVSALSELDEEAVTLIVDLDGEVRGQVLKLVEEVLEQVYCTDGGVPPRSGEFSENNMETATWILMTCGLKLSEDSLDPSLGSPGAPDEALLALYISLKGVDMLLGP